MAQNTTDDVDVEQNPIESDRLVRAFANPSAVRMLVALADADSPLSPGDITSRAGVSRNAWYDNRDRLLDLALVEEAGKVGNSQTYRLADTDAGEAVADLHDAMRVDDVHDGPLTDEMKREMFEWFEANEYEYREDPDTAAEVVHEDDRHIVVADHSGHELNEWADDFGIDRDELSAWMHERARAVYGGDGVGDPWAVVDPVVFEKADADDE